MPNSGTNEESVKIELANRVFFRLYQCANMLHKTGTKAVEAEGLTTQQWAVLGALSRPAASGGMSVGDLARYLKVSRQNLSGLLGRMERDGRIQTAADEFFTRQTQQFAGADANLLVAAIVIGNEDGRGGMEYYSAEQQLKFFGSVFREPADGDGL